MYKHISSHSMLVTCLLICLLYNSGQCQDFFIPNYQHNDEKMIECVIGILTKYFTGKKGLTYVNMNPDDDDLLQTIHSTLYFSLIARSPTKSMFVPNQAYLVFLPDVDTFTDYFEELIREILWNPYARFLIIIESLQDYELRRVFDVLLRVHVNNVVLLNGTDEGHLYTYNPFDKYACGRYYDEVIRYGLCAETTQNLYPNKLVTGLKNCTFRGTTTHRPPFSIDPAENKYRNKIQGMEQYLLELASEKDGFKINVEFNYKGSTFSTVSPNMTATKGFDMLQKNDTDVIFGAMMIIAARAAAFSYLYGYHDYVDELRFAVRKAPLVPYWKYFYLEFSVLVWILLLISLVIYSLIMMHLLPKHDKGDVIMELLDNLLLHSRAIHCSMTVKYVLLFWVWFAYLINTFYQSSLVSLTTNPIKEYQISTSDDMEKYNIRPCLGTGLAIYVYTETKQREEYNKTRFADPACENVLEAAQLVSHSSDIFTLIPSYFYLYNKQSFNDKYGEHLIHYLDNTYAKLMLGYYFYKGFPLSSRFRTRMLLMRENGLAEKNVRDQYYLRSIKFSYAQKEFETRFVYPWFVYVVGCSLAILSFIIEILSKYIKRSFSKSVTLPNKRKRFFLSFR